MHKSNSFNINKLAYFVGAIMLLFFFTLSTDANAKGKYQCCPSVYGGQQCSVTGIGKRGCEARYIGRKGAYYPCVYTHGGCKPSGTRCGAGKHCL